MKERYNTCLKRIKKHEGGGALNMKKKMRSVTENKAGENTKYKIKIETKS
jgi:hypothetical protein